MKNSPIKINCSSVEGETTIGFYNENAQEYFNRTVVIDMKPAMQAFLEYVGPTGKILDAGCGSGRDTKIFQELGYDVTAIDASLELVKLSSEYTGKKTIHMTFQEMAFESVFDGIWCSASLLHVPSAELLWVLKNCKRALKPGGIWFLSFMYGEQEEVRAGRFFHHVTQTKLSRYLEDVGGLTILKCSIEKSYENGKSRDWLQCYVQKQGLMDVICDVEDDRSDNNR